MHIEPGQRFIPYHTFPKNFDFLDILHDLVRRGMITRTEKEVARYLNGCGYKDGEIYPKQTTIARNVGICRAQVNNVLKSLKEKKIIEVETPSLVLRHLCGNSCRYYFIFHPVYSEYLEKGQPRAVSEEIIHEIRQETGQETPYIEIRNQRIVKNPESALPGLFADGGEKSRTAVPGSENTAKESAGNISPVRNSAAETGAGIPAAERQVDGSGDRAEQDVSEVQSICKKIHAKITEKGENRFHAGKFAGRYLKIYPAEAVAYALDAVLKKMESCGNAVIFRAFDFWGYGKKVIDREGPNINEARHRAQAQRYAEGLKELAGVLFGGGAAFGRSAAWA